MTTEPTLLDFNRVLQDLAGHLFSLVDAKLGAAAAWTQAVLDVRSPEEGGTQIAKFRIHLPDGSATSARIPAVVNGLIREAWLVKQSAFPEQWYGLKLKLLPSGDCETEFDYDPACFDDPNFFDI